MGEQQTGAIQGQGRRKEAERITFAKIDQHDQAILHIIEFTATDAPAELPPPMSVQEVELWRYRQLAPARAKMKCSRTTTKIRTRRGGRGKRRRRRRREEREQMRDVERARAIQASSLGAGGPMKIETDYVPKLGAKAKASATTSCTKCRQQIPVDELTEHMRIELLDPRWKLQRDALEACKAQTPELQRGANVVSPLKTLARTPVDVFGAAPTLGRSMVRVVREPLRGHPNWVRTVAFSPDGKHIASGSSDVTIRPWDAETGKPVGEPLLGHDHWVRSVAYSPDDTRMVSGFQGKNIRVWDAQTRQTVLGPLREHRREVFSVSLSPDGQNIVSGSFGGMIRIWDAHSEQTVAGSFVGSSNSVWSVVFSPDGKRVVSGGEDGLVKVWDAEND